MFGLKWQTPFEWVEVVSENFGAFLVNHADCERKAASMAMNLIGKHSYHTELVEKMSLLASEEMEHFHKVFNYCQELKVRFSFVKSSEYTNELFTMIRRKKPKELLTDKLLIASLVEARSCERFYLLSENLEDEEKRNFYKFFFQAEAKHHSLFVDLAKLYEKPTLVETRLEELKDKEAEVISQIHFSPKVH